jgi:hypothetical protein
MNNINYDDIKHLPDEVRGKLISESDSITFVEDITGDQVVKKYPKPKWMSIEDTIKSTTWLAETENKILKEFWRTGEIPQSSRRRLGTGLYYKIKQQMNKPEVKIENGAVKEITITNPGPAVEWTGKVGNSNSLVLGKSNYFTPSIEDIRVGYNFEWQRNDTKIWKSSNISSSGDLEGNWEEMIVNNKIRVPYLTKTQIAGEGWDLLAEYESGNRWVKFQKIPKVGNPIFLYFNDKNWLTIEQTRVSGESVPLRYSGECKCINTFRYICKLLNIN